MLLGDFPDDGQPQAAALGAGVIDAVEALEHEFGLFFADADAVVLDFENRKVAVAQHTAGDLAAGRGIAQRIVDQIVGQLAQQESIAANDGRAAGFKAEILAGRDGAHHPVFDDFAQELVEIERLLFLMQLVAGFGTG